MDVEKAMATDCSTLAWKIPWMEEPGRLQSMGLLRVGHDRATSLSLFTFLHGEGNGNLLQCSSLENPRDGRAWWAAGYGVTQNQTRLKRLSSSSSINWKNSFNLSIYKDDKKICLKEGNSDYETNYLFNWLCLSRCAATVNNVRLMLW